MLLIPVADLNHGSILEEPSDQLVDLVKKALGVENERDYGSWLAEATTATRSALADMGRWQQFIVRAVDERGDPITDYFVEFYSVADDGEEILHGKAFADVHAYQADKSFRCIHVDLKELNLNS